MQDYAKRRYDAVVFGWGSFHHLLDRADRELAIRACAKLARAGPLLISYWRRLASEPEGHVAPAARDMGRVIRSARGIGRSDVQLMFTSNAGFRHPLAPEELEQIARCVGRPCHFGPAGGFAHVVLARARAAKG